ncbi:4'-phosphopantetheinyl transferase family protein [Rhizobium leguminosarum]
MSDLRRREFAWGRACAREALARFDPGFMSIGKDDNGVPIWPDGFCGSIAHTQGMACAVVCPVGQVTGIGVDVERICSLESYMASTICRKEEMPALHEIERRGGPAAALVGFVAKEAAFKALYPRLRQFLEFHDVYLTFSDASSHLGGRFSLAELFIGGGNLPAKLDGRWACCGEFIFAGAEFHLVASDENRCTKIVYA